MNSEGINRFGTGGHQQALRVDILFGKKEIYDPAFPTHGLTCLIREFLN